jgi:sterol desaturase/sphingolipid hydroxylase (fatty acid hydroxylase superfamily)
MQDLFFTIVRLLELAVGWVFSSSWLPPQDFQFFRWLFIPGYGYGFLLVTAGILELLYPHHRRPWSRASLLSGTYLLLVGKIGVYMLVVAPLARQAWIYLGLPSLHLSRILPAPVFLVVSLLVVTFIGYWAHRLLHRISYLWHIHKIHHSPRNLNWTSIYHMHFLEKLLVGPGHLITALALGTELVAPLGIILMTLDVLGHANIGVDMGRLSYFISTPQAHRIHHSMDPKHHDSNFGTSIMLWDHLFGTFYYSPDDPPSAYGVDDTVPETFIKQQIMPLVWIARDANASLLRLYSRLRGHVEELQPGK